VETRTMPSLRTLQMSVDVDTGVVTTTLKDSVVKNQCGSIIPDFLRHSVTSRIDCSMATDGDTSSPIIFTNRIMFGLANDADYTLRFPAARVVSSVWIYYHTLNSAVSDKRLRTFELGVRASEDAECTAVAGLGDEQFAAAQDVQSGWVEFRFDAATALELCLTSLNGGHSTYKGDIYLFELKATHIEGIDGLPQRQQAALLPPVRPSRVQGWCVKRTAINITETKEKTWSFGHLKSTGFVGNREQKLRIAQIENPMKNMPCAADVAVQVDIPLIEKKNCATRLCGGSDKWWGNYKHTEIYLTSDGGTTELRDVSANDPKVQTTFSRTYGSCDRQSGTDHPTKAGYCHIHNEVYGPSMTSGPRLRAADTIYMDVFPPQGSNHWSARNTVKWKIDPQVISITFWWKPPIDTMECDAQPGQLQVGRVEP